MDGVEVLKLFGLGLGFVGSVLLSIGLVKSRQQIDDETGSYWGQNPFLRENILGERKLVIIGFIALLAGFAFQLSTTITFYPVGAEVFGAIAIGVALTLVGVLSLLLFVQSRESHHRRRHEAHYRRVLRRQTESMIKRLSTPPITEHPEMVQSWLTESLTRLREFKGDLAPELWSSLDDGLVRPMESEREKTAEQLLKHLAEFQARHLSSAVR